MNNNHNILDDFFNDTLNNDDTAEATTEDHHNDDDNNDNDNDNDMHDNDDDDDHQIIKCPHCKQQYEEKQRYYHDLTMCPHWNVQRINTMTKVNNILRTTHISSNRTKFEAELAEVEHFMEVLRQEIKMNFRTLPPDDHPAFVDPTSHEALVYILKANVKLHPRTHATIRRYLDENAIRQYELQMLGENAAEHFFLHTSQYCALYLLAVHKKELQELINDPFYHDVNINTWLAEEANRTAMNKDHTRTNTLFAPKGDMRHRMAMIIITTYLIKTIILDTYK